MTNCCLDLKIFRDQFTEKPSLDLLTIHANLMYVESCIHFNSLTSRYYCGAVS